MRPELSRRQFIGTASAASFAAASLPAAFAQSDKKVTLAFAGVAHIHTPGFINLLKSRDDVKVKSVWDHDAARAESRAKDVGAEPVKDVKQIWSDPNIAAVVICSETNRHRELAMAGAKAGKHL